MIAVLASPARIDPERLQVRAAILGIERIRVSGRNGEPVERPDERTIANRAAAVIVIREAAPPSPPCDRQLLRRDEPESELAREPLARTHLCGGASDGRSRRLVAVNKRAHRLEQPAASAKGSSLVRAPACAVAAIQARTGCHTPFGLHGRSKSATSLMVNGWRAPRQSRARSEQRKWYFATVNFEKTKPKTCRDFSEAGGTRRTRKAQGDEMLSKWFALPAVIASMLVATGAAQA